MGAPHCPAHRKPQLPVAVAGPRGGDQGGGRRERSRSGSGPGSCPCVRQCHHGIWRRRRLGLWRRRGRWRLRVRRRKRVRRRRCSSRVRRRRCSSRVRRRRCSSRVRRRRPGSVGVREPRACQYRRRFDFRPGLRPCSLDGVRGPGREPGIRSVCRPECVRGLRYVRRRRPCPCLCASPRRGVHVRARPNRCISVCRSGSCASSGFRVWSRCSLGRRAKQCLWLSALRVAEAQPQEQT